MILFREKVLSTAFSRLTFCFFTHAIIEKRGESIITIDAFDTQHYVVVLRATTI